MDMILEFLITHWSHLVVIAIALIVMWIEHRKQVKLRNEMKAFLHGLKASIEGGVNRPTSTPSDWQPLLIQVNDRIQKLT